MFAATKSGSADAKDPQFNYVTMLLHGNGTNGAQNNTFVDSSTNNFTITRNGNTTQGTFTPYGSNWSNYLNGSSSLSVNVSGVAAGTSTFTFEAWVYLNAYPASDAPFYDTRSSNGATTTAMQFGVYSTGALKFYDGTETNLGGTVPLNQWVHIALVRNGSNVMTPYINGTATGTTVSSTRNFSDQYFWIGSVPGPASPYINAYLSNLRWVVGTAVYTSNFTPSTTPLTAITNTKILTCQSNRFVDNSSNTFAITLNGSPSVQRFSPFSPTTAYSTSVIGGSGYFDGSGDYLDAGTNAAFAVGTGDFTIELWVYPTAFSGTYTGYFTTRTGGQGFDITTINSSATLMLGNNSGAVISANNVLSLNTWQHICAVRSGSTNSLYVNGTRVATGTDSTNFTDNGAKVCSSGPSGGNNGVGYISNVRLVKGTAVYSPSSSTLTVPTAPLSAVSGTSLLCSMTNAGILDNAMMNDLETVGNAQISTSVKKYGTGSLAFDGTGDLLVSSPKNILALGGGNFTIEMWIYPNNVSTNAAWLVAQTDYTSNTGWSVFLNNNIVTFRLGNTGGTIQSSASVVASAWQHLALSRVGTTLTMYLDGTSIGSGTVNNFTDANLASVVGGITTTTGWNNNLAYNGYIDDLRITKGVARYTANFTAPTTAFADKG